MFIWQESKLNQLFIRVPQGNARKVARFRDWIAALHSLFDPLDSIITDHGDKLEIVSFRAHFEIVHNESIHSFLSRPSSKAGIHTTLILFHLWDTSSTSSHPIEDPNLNRATQSMLIQNLPNNFFF